jgi:hypothetical protein
MLRPLSTVVLAASVWTAVLALPALAKDSDALPASASAVTASSAVTARAQTAAPAAKRIRKANTHPRRIAVATPVAYYPQCFLFWCTAGGRSYNFLMLGVAY